MSVSIDRSIVCFRIPSFEITLARVDDRTLRGRPVATASMAHARAVLREVSSEAERDGLWAGMTVAHARWRCPSLRLLPSSPSRILRGERLLGEIIERFAPTWEALLPGHVFLDLTGTHRLFGKPADAARRIEREIVRAHGLAAAVAVGTNKLVTNVASSLLEPAQSWDIVPGDEGAFMAPLPPAVLPELRGQPGRKSLTVLEDLHLRTLGEVAEVPAHYIERVLGRAGRSVHQHARGIDPTPVVARPDQTSVRAAAVLDPETHDAASLGRRTAALVERLCGELRGRQRGCGTLRLTVVYSDRVETSRGAVFPETCWEADIGPRAMQLLAKCFTRRVGVRRLIAEAGRLVPYAEQMQFFARDQTRIHLSVALDRIRHRFGHGAVRWGADAVPADT